MTTPANRTASRWYLPWLLVVLLVLTAAALAGGWTWYFLRDRDRDAAGGTLAGLQVFGVLPEFSLVERQGRSITRSDLFGKVWVANFIYTRCTDTCPLQSARMAALQRDFPGEHGLRFLSITVDPKRDTLAALDTYAARYEADRERWWFLTGDKAAIYALIRDGFRLSVEDPTDSAAPAPALPHRQGRLGCRACPRVAEPTDFQRTIGAWLAPAPALAHSDSEFLAPPFLHSSWFVLGDRRAQIRGYYKTEAEQAVRLLRGDIRALLAER